MINKYKYIFTECDEKKRIHLLSLNCVAGLDSRRAHKASNKFSSSMSHENDLRRKGMITAILKKIK